MRWIHENPPHWDAEKERILGSAPPGALELPSYGVGDLLPGEWVRAAGLEAMMFGALIVAVVLLRPGGIAGRR